MNLEVSIETPLECLRQILNSIRVTQDSQKLGREHLLGHSKLSREPRTCIMKTWWEIFINKPKIELRFNV